MSLLVTVVIETMRLNTKIKKNLLHFDFCIYSWCCNILNFIVLLLSSWFCRLLLSYSWQSCCVDQRACQPLTGGAQVSSTGSTSSLWPPSKIWLFVVWESAVACLHRDSSWWCCFCCRSWSIWYWSWNGRACHFCILSFSCVLLATVVTPPEVRAWGGKVPECDGAAAETDVVRSSGSCHGTRLGPAFSPPTAPWASLGSFPFRWIVCYVSWPFTVPSWNVEFCQRLRNSELMWSWVNVNVMNRVFQRAGIFQQTAHWLCNDGTSNSLRSLWHCFE